MKMIKKASSKSTKSNSGNNGGKKSGSGKRTVVFVKLK